MALLETTHELLRSRIAAGVKIPEIVKASAGEIGREWLYKFAAGDIGNPGVNTVQSLHDCLAKLKPKSAA